MSAYWFKPKSRGYGSVPTTWQGWLLILGFAALVTAIVLAVLLKTLSLFWCVVIVLAVTAFFLALSRAKTDGEWRWR